MKQTDKSTTERRSFLKGAAVAGAAVGSGAISTAAVAEVSEEKIPAVKKGYQETDHVREYYRLARF